MQSTLITSNGEIKRLLTNIYDNKVAITIFSDDTLNSLTSTIDSIDFNTGFITYNAPLPTFRRPLLTKNLVSVTCKYQDTIVRIPDIQITKENLVGSDNYISEIPNVVYVFQKRAFYRQKIIEDTNIYIKINNASTELIGSLNDISFGGCNIVTINNNTLNPKTNQRLDFRIFFDDKVILLCKVIVRRTFIIDNKTLIGCSFIDISKEHKQVIVDLVSRNLKNHQNNLKQTNEAIKDDITVKYTRTYVDNFLLAKEAYDYGLTTVQSIQNHYSLNKEIPIRQMDKCCKLFLNALEEDRQSLIILSKTRSIETYHLQKTIDLLINLTDFIKSNTNGLSNEQIVNVMIGCLLHNTYQTLHVSGVERQVQTPKETIKNNFQCWKKYLYENIELDKISLNIIENHLEFIDGSGLPCGKNKNELNLISRISAVIYHYQIESHTSKNNTFYYKPYNKRNFEVKYKNKLDSTVTDKMFKRMGSFPLGSTVALKNNKLALVMRHTLDNLPSHLRVVYDLERKQLVTPIDMTITPSEISLIEGTCNPYFYNIPCTLLNNIINLKL